MSAVIEGTGRLPEGQLLRASTVARAIGVSRSTIYRWLQEGPLVEEDDFVRMGPRRAVRIRRAAALRLMEEGA